MKTFFSKTLFITIASFICHSASTAQLDSLGVVAFYNSTGGPNWTNNTHWLTSAPLANWFGLTVSGGRVTDINLPNNNLISANISDSLNLLTAAQSFNFSHNKLSGLISSLLALSPTMQIDLTYNYFDFRIEYLVRHHNVVSYPQSVGVPMRYHIHPANDSITFYPVTYSPSGLIISSQIDRIADGNTTVVAINTDPICNLIFDSLTVPNLPGSYYANMVDDACAYAPGNWSLYLNSDTITIGSTLPINFIDFNGNISHNTALLNWQTAGGMDASYFDIQRSADGRLFNDMGKVTAGNSNAVQNYQFTDHLSALNPLPKTLYYRLKEVDKNGSVAYSRTLPLNTSSYGEASLSVYPNPVKDLLHITLNNVTGSFSLIITNVEGKRLLTKQFAGAGLNNIVTLNTSGLAAGIYFLRVEGSGKTIVGKFIKQ
jgi:hypothetical protein